LIRIHAQVVGANFNGVAEVRAIEDAAAQMEGVDFAVRYRRVRTGLSNRTSARGRTPQIP
jgi:hypothetical protein